MTSSCVDMLIRYVSPLNLALGKPSSQSSVYNRRGPENANNGSCDGQGMNRCTHTQLDIQPWWEVGSRGKLLLLLLCHANAALLARACLSASLLLVQCRLRVHVRSLTVLLLLLLLLLWWWWWLRTVGRPWR